MTPTILALLLAALGRVRAVCRDRARARKDRDVRRICREYPRLWAVPVNHTGEAPAKAGE